MITKWSGGTKIDDPDGSEATWKRVGNPDLPVCYTRGSNATFFAKISLSPPPPPGMAVDLRVKQGNTVIATKNGVTLNAATTTVTDITTAMALESNVKKTRFTFTWQVRDAGSSDEWCTIGTSEHTMYWTHADPLATPFENFDGSTYAPLYDLALEKACSYAASGGDTADARTIRTRVASGIDGDVTYNPGNLLGNVHPLNAYSIAGGCLCADLAFLHHGLIRSIGIDGDIRYFWAGTAATWKYYDPWRGSFRILAAAHDSARANPHFTYHAMVLSGGKYYDASYGVERTGLTFDETAPGEVQRISATWVTAVPIDAVFTCPHPLP